jgi:hypothetical protein
MWKCNCFKDAVCFKVTANEDVISTYSGVNPFPRNELSLNRVLQCMLHVSLAYNARFYKNIL